jgi:transposase
MLHLSASCKYYLYSGPADMRKGFDGLSGIVKSQMTMNTLNGAVFIFLNKRRTHIKLLLLCEYSHKSSYVNKKIMQTGSSPTQYRKAKN